MQRSYDRSSWQIASSGIRWLCACMRGSRGSRQPLDCSCAFSSEPHTKEHCSKQQLHPRFVCRLRVASREELTLSLCCVRPNSPAVSIRRVSHPPPICLLACAVCGEWCEGAMCALCASTRALAVDSALLCCIRMGGESAVQCSAGSDEPERRRGAPGTPTITQERQLTRIGAPHERQRRAMSAPLRSHCMSQPPLCLRCRLCAHGQCAFRSVDASALTSRRPQQRLAACSRCCDAARNYSGLFCLTQYCKQDAQQRR